MEYTMTIKVGDLLTEDEADEALCAFGDNYDAATVRERSLVVDGYVRQRDRLTRIMGGVRVALGWRPVEFHVETVAA